MEAIIGRQENAAEPRLKITSDQGKVLTLGKAGSVPKSVSRQHCKLQVVGPDDFILTNMKPENKTMVNGIAIASKHISLTDRVELGKDMYVLDIPALVAALSAIPATISSDPTSVSITHLRLVWEKYSQAKLDMQIQQGKENALSSISGLFTMGAAACAFIPGVPGGLRIFLYAVAACLAAYFMFSRYRRAAYYPRLQSDIDKQFRQDYVCPNPECQRFLGYQPYEEISKNKNCIYCKCNYLKV